MFRGQIYSRRRTVRNSFTTEQLEQKVLLAVFHVQQSATGEVGGTGTPENPFTRIASALEAAKANAGTDEIQVAAGTYEEIVSVSDPGEVTVIGDAVSRPILTGSFPLTLSAPFGTTAFRNFQLRPTGSLAIGVNRFGVGNDVYRRSGNLTLENISINMLNGPGTALSLIGLHSFSATNVATIRGRIDLSDIGTATLNQVSIDNPNGGGVSASWVHQLSINGLSVGVVSGTGLFVSNTTRSSTGFPTPPINAPAVLTANNVTVNGATGNGLDVGSNITVNVSNSSFNNNAGIGAYLNMVTTTTLANVEASDNARGFVVWQGHGSVAGQNITANRNDFDGFFATDVNSVSVSGGEFLNNLAAGFAAIGIAGTAQLSGINANHNSFWGILLTNMTGNVSLASLTTNDNGRTGTLIGQNILAAGAALPSLTFSGGESRRNIGLGMDLFGFDGAVISGLTATGNTSYGTVLSGTLGSTSVSTSRFDRNWSGTTSGFRPGMQVLGCWRTRSMLPPSITVTSTATALRPA